MALTTSVYPSLAAQCSGVFPSYKFFAYSVNVCLRLKRHSNSATFTHGLLTTKGIDVSSTCTLCTDTIKLSYLVLDRQVGPQLDQHGGHVCGLHQVQRRVAVLQGIKVCLVLHNIIIVHLETGIDKIAKLR